jgi:hypothetical protein
MEQLIKGRQGLFVSLRSALSRIPSEDFAQYCAVVPKSLQIPDQLLKSIRAIRTSLDRFSDVEATALMYHAYTMTDCFLWCYRDRFSSKYRVPAKSAPNWTIEMTPEIVASWEMSLRNSNRTLSIR